MARGVSREVRLSRERAARVWAAVSAAVEEVCGAPPPTEPGALRGGRRQDQASALRRKFALYTAVCGLGVRATHIAPLAGVRPQWVTEEVLRDLEARRGDPEVDWLLEELLRLAKVNLAGGA